MEGGKAEREREGEDRLTEGWKEGRKQERERDCRRLPGKEKKKNSEGGE